jgi:hypothetical protein
LAPKAVTDSGIVTEIRPLQPEKAYLSIMLTDEGMSIEASDTQLESIELEILASDSERVMEVSSSQWLKALFPIAVTELGITIDLSVVQE